MATNGNAGADRSVAIGVAGWSYPDWEQPVYGGRVRERLRFLAGYVDMVEINSTFYRPPSAATGAAWAKQVADRPAFFSPSSCTSR